MSKTRTVEEMSSSFVMKDHFHKFVQQLKKSLEHLASDKSHGVSAPLSLNDLPEECISNIISFTSPQDACIFASVSKTFESAVNSDIVWEKFIPPEYEFLISGSQDFSSKKEIYFALCHEYIQIYDDKVSLWVTKPDAKKCFMLPAMMLSITWGDSPESWKWITLPDSNKLVVELLEVNMFEIRGRIESRILAPRTRYSAYVVFKKTDIFNGFKDVAIEAVVGVVGQDLDESCRRYVCFDEASSWRFLTRNNQVNQVWRNDGWIEIKLGEFFNQGGLKNKDLIEMAVFETKQNTLKRGLIIQGIEIRLAYLR